MDMDRRDLLRAGALSSASAATLATGGCAPPATGAATGGLPFAGGDLDAFLGRFDRGLADIQTSRFVAGFTESLGGAPIPEAKRAHVEERERDFREALSSLYLTQTFRDLPPEKQFHPEVQRRMLDNIHAIDASVFRTTDRLEQLGPREREAIRTTLKRHPDLSMRIAEVVDVQAAAAGITPDRRRDFRAMMTQAAFRLKNQPPGVLIDEYVKKVRRATAPDAPEFKRSLELAAAASERYFWDHGIALTSAATAPRTNTRAPRPVAAAPEPGKQQIVSGAILLGVGVVIFGVSAAVVSAGWFPGVFGMTIGAVTFAVGLIVLIVGALISAFS
jgi:hypothetical protein